MFIPIIGKMNPFLTSIFFQMGWLKPPTSFNGVLTRKFMGATFFGVPGVPGVPPGPPGPGGFVAPGPGGAPMSGPPMVPPQAPGPHPGPPCGMYGPAQMMPNGQMQPATWRTKEKQKTWASGGKALNISKTFLKRVNQIKSVWGKAAFTS